jgi:DNA polymerase-3 subunit epsilon
MKMNDFIAIDFETAMYAQSSAISIGLVKYRDYEAVDTFYSLIRPPKLYIRPDFTDIHGLTIEDVKDAPDFKHIWNNGILDFLEEMPLVAHNASFDIGVLKAVLKWYKQPVPRLSYFCSCSLARKTWPGLKSYSLTALAENFEIIYNAHNALDDARTCGQLVQMSTDVFGKEKSIKSLLRAAGIKMKVLDGGEEKYNENINNKEKK